MMHCYKYQNVDLESTLECADEFIKNHLNDDFYDDEWVNRKFYESILSPKYSGRIQTFVAKDSPFGETVGFIMGSKQNVGIYEIRQHYVKEEFRRQGIATALKTYLCNQAFAQGYLIVTSDVSKNNIASIRLNEKLGWFQKELDNETYRYITVKNRGGK